MKNIKSSVSLFLFLFFAFNIAAQNSSIIEPEVENAADNKPQIQYDSAENTVLVTSRKLNFTLPNSGTDPLVKARMLAVNFSFNNEGKAPTRPLFISIAINEIAALSISGDIPVTSNFDSTVERISSAQIGYTLKKTNGELENKKLTIPIELDEPSSAAIDISSKSHSHLSMAQLQLKQFIELSQAEEIYILIDKRKYFLHIPKSAMSPLQELAKTASGAEAI